MESIENENLIVQINSKGAEVCSIFDKNSRVEHIWQADAEIWGRHAPILFPIVGQLEGGNYEYKNQTFKMSQHGFARDSEFKLKEKFDNSLIFELKSSGDTLMHYPYDFILTVLYRLEGRKLHVRYKVENTNSVEMPFSIGAHPGFNCPFSPEEDFEDYYLEFSEKETSDRLLFNDGLLTGAKEEKYLNNSNVLDLNYGLFDNDALIFDTIKSEYVTLKSTKHDKFLRIGVAGFPFLGIWTKPGKNAPFLCIEPWYGITDTRGAGLPFSEKQGRISIDPEGVFECSYSVTV